MTKDQPTMVERVARAIVKRNYPSFIDAEIDAIWEAWVEDATTAINAMREPTLEVKLAGASAITADHMKKMANFDAAVDAWHAMIDAAQMKEPGK